MTCRRWLWLVAVVALPSTAPAQSWNSAEARALMQRAIARRDTGPAFRDYTAQAHGFVLFSAQMGEEFADPPRLVKADQLALEVYWRAPGASKQRIVGRRERIDLPSGIQYHRDHLGIVQNNYPDRIRLGNCAEVCGVLHPVARQAPRVYQYAIVDSLTIGFADREVRVYEVLVRPTDPSQPRVVGTLFLERDTGQIVRLRLGFTRSAYRDDALEDITILLDNALWDGRHWLPRYQEIEIRRRSAWFDLAARGIITIAVEIDQYVFDVGLDDRLFLGPEIVQAPATVRNRHPWPNTLDDALAGRTSAPVSVDLEAVRTRIREVASAQVVSGLAGTQPSIGSLSDLAHFNRVEGLALGVGAVARLDGAELRFGAGLGLSDERPKGRVRLDLGPRRLRLTILAARRVRDVGDSPVGSGVINSILAQELGEDFGDYYLLDEAKMGMRVVHRGVSFSTTVGWEHITSLRVTAGAATGNFRTNPDLGSGHYGVAVGEVTWQGARLARSRGGGSFRVEAGVGGGDGARASVGYGRLSGWLEGSFRIGPGDLVNRAWGGVATNTLPAHRVFVGGGRGTLVGEPFRAWGGRAAAIVRSEWRLTAAVPEVGLGSFLTTGRALVIAPFAGVGWAGRPLPQTGWPGSDGLRPVTGLAIEWFHRILRLEVGVGWRDGGVRVAFDVQRDLWPLL